MHSRRTLLSAALAAPFIIPFRAARAGKPKVVIAQPSAGFNYLPVYVAKSMGIFEQEGLDAEAVVFERGASAALTAVLGGDATVYVGLPAIPLQARAKGQRTKIFAALYDQWGSDIVLSREAYERSGLRSSSSNKDKASALKGLNIAVAGAGSITDLLVRHVAKFAGLEPDRDLTIVPIGGGANMLAAFAQKKIDGFSLSSPTSTIGWTTMGGKNLFDFSNGEYEPLRGFLYTALSARDDWLEREAETAAKVVRCMWRAQREMLLRPAEAKASIRQAFGRIEDKTLDGAWDGIMPGFGRSLAVAPEGVLRNYEFLRSTRGDFPASPLQETITNAFAQPLGKID